QRRAVTVKEIAQRCFISHQTASGQLRELREKGYVQSTNIGRESYYELQEPLMRLCIEVKMHQDKPIRLFVDFLRLWYPLDDLQNRLLLLPPDAFERDYVAQAIQMANSEADPLILACLKDCEEYVNNDDFINVLKVIEELIDIQNQN